MKMEWKKRKQVKLKKNATEKSRRALYKVAKSCWVKLDDKKLNFGES